MISGTTAKAKFKRLQRRLKLPHWQCMGLLEAMWELTAHSQPDGGLGRLSNEEFASFIQFDGDENALVAALLETGWLDPFEHPDHPTVRFVVHHWADHAPNFIKANLWRHGRDFLVPSTKRRRDDSEESPKGGSPGEVPHGRLPREVPKRRPTKPNQTKPNQETPPPTPSGVDRGGGEGGGVSASPPEEPSPEPSPPEASAPSEPDPGTEPAEAYPDDGLARAHPVAFQAAEDALVAAGVKRATVAPMLAALGHRRVPVSDVVTACKHAVSGGYHSPGGALDWWAKSHRGGLDPLDPASWPKPNAPPPKARSPSPERTREQTIHAAVCEAKAGRVDQAVAMLEGIKLDRAEWPAVVLHKLEKVNT